MINRDLCYHHKYKRNIFLDICCMFTFNCVFKKKNELNCVLCVYEYSKAPVLGTCATFSTTAPLVETKKGGARCGGAKVKNNGMVARMAPV